MLGQFTWKNQADCGLNFPTSNGGRLVHAAKLRSFVGDLVEGVSDEVVHDCNTLLRDTGIWMNLLQHLEDVGLEGRWRATLLHGLRCGLHGFCHCEE